MPTNFSVLGVDPLFQQSLTDLNIHVPTDIQQKTIPLILNETKDIVALAKTGSGKTLAFGLPLLQKIQTDLPQIQMVILSPTRELGQQIHSNLSDFSAHHPAIGLAAICGGIPIKPQIERLQSTTHLVVATPGRLLDLVNRKAIDLSHVNYLVLDEADEMLNAHSSDLEKIFLEIPKNRRTLLFTATLPGNLKQLIQNALGKHPIQIEADMETMGHQGIDHRYIVVDPIEKLEVLLHFLSGRENEKGIIFCKTKAAVNKLGKNLAINKFSSGALHGSLTQGIRDRVMDQFREGNINILVATDLAARGLDVKDVSYVVNYHLPDTYEAYVHRSGRTARAGAKGFSLTVLQEEEVGEIPEFEEELGIFFSEIKKADAESTLENNTLLWAKKIFKTKPNRVVSDELKEKVKTIFHHLTKDELIEKILAHHLQQVQDKLPKTEENSSSKKRKR
ncbi:MAG TPA: DEAD/DEAH box helicase [Moheibacter sp.]|nr:DEAD/DEAH box helicase [Moheibacter sp.]